nr:MAG TPA: hypothetical protein [Caudoviricetes sp.]
MKKFTFIGSVVLLVICVICTHSYAETYYKTSKQYEMCFQDNSLSIKEKLDCADTEYRRILTCILNDVSQFKKISSIPQNTREDLMDHIDKWFGYEQSRVQIELLTAQDIGGMYQVIGVLNEQIQRALHMQDWVMNTIEALGDKYIESSDDAE